MSPTRVRELPEAPIAGPHRQAGRDPAAVPPGRPAEPATATRRAGAAVAGFARRLRALPGSMDFGSSPGRRRCSSCGRPDQGAARPFRRGRETGRANLDLLRKMGLWN
jgi:hypothetical protein